MRFSSPLYLTDIQTKQFQKPPTDFTKQSRKTSPDSKRIFYSFPNPYSAACNILFVIVKKIK